MRRIRFGKAAFCFADSLLDSAVVDRALVDIEEGYVVEGDLVKEDDELHQICVSLLPERLLPAAKEIIQKRCDVIGQGIGVEVVMQRVVSVRRIEADFDIVLCPAVSLQYLPDPMAEVSFDLKN